MVEIDVLGIHVPDAGPVFPAFLTVHVAAGLPCVGSGVLAILTRKGGVWHRRFGRVYLWGLLIVFVTLTALSVIRWRENAHLFVIGVVAFSTALADYLNRRRAEHPHRGNGPLVRGAGDRLLRGQRTSSALVEPAPHMELLGPAHPHRPPANRPGDQA
ncbi:hypothetical protein Pth03_25430 [Planotetraspora thailandica]|uniref:DUF2306 domain-containing protein n=1 Tax=Planotetraspora thailandica TaxID=487172 RepID=A0A8J3XVC7_9ACTN|nr:hypothetical protein [Planotetraspora thailandica]GII54154.1 hypothetical protein Pth03_25430 [Planotetraspora thailandica]